MSVLDAAWVRDGDRWSHPALPAFLGRLPEGADGSDGHRVILFAEAYCRQTRGRRAGDPVRLRDWQKQVLVDVFATLEGVRLYRRGLLGLPRKNGKSLLGAIIALYCLVADGEAGAEVYSCAGDRRQAGVVFEEAKSLIARSPKLREALVVTRDEITHPRSGSRYRALSAEAYTKEGLNPSCVIFDEVHVQPYDALWDVMTLGSGTRERPLVLGITTAGYDKATPCGRMYDMGIEGAPDGFYSRWWEPPVDADYTAQETWRRCNPGLDLDPWWQAYHAAYAALGSHVEAERAALEAVPDGAGAPRPDFLSERDMRSSLPPATSENAFRRYRLNQWTSSVEAWLPFGAWDACESSRRLEPGEDCVLGFDGSFAGDSTALVACTPDGFFAVLGAWERPAGPAGDGWRVDIAEVEEAILEACRTYGVRAVACDPFRWQRSLQALAAQGVPVEEYPQTPARMIPASTSFYDAVLDGQVAHDGNADLARHLGNVFVKQTRNGPQVTKEHRMSARKIDLAIAAIIAYDVARQSREPEYSYPHVW